MMLLLRKTMTNPTSVTVSISCTVLAQAFCATLTVTHQLWASSGFPTSSSMWSFSLLPRSSLAGDPTSQTALLGVSSPPGFLVSFLSPVLGRAGYKSFYNGGLL